MKRAGDDPAHLSDEVERLAAELNHHVRAIASELKAPPPRNGAGITAAGHQITRLIRAFAPVHQRVTAAQARVAAEAREAGVPGGRLPPAWYSLMTRANGLRTAMARWFSVQGLIAAQHPPRRRALYVRAEDAPDILPAQAGAGDALLMTLQAVLSAGEQDAAAADRGCFADIALPQSHFLAHVHAAYRVLLAQGIGRASFLDVGCGGGIKPLAATHFFERVAGIELDPGYAEAARGLLRRAGRGDVLILQGDAAEFDDYAAFDVIYMFRPMRDEDAMKRLEQVVLARARPGTLVIAPYRGFVVRHEDLGCARIDGNLFLANAGVDEAARLREAAEYTGPSVCRRRPDLPDMWEPILAASQANGFALERERWIDGV